MLLSIKNLTFGWQRETLFESIFCELQQGEVIQLTGENGVGKTTLLQLISGMIPHFNRGEILCGDIIFNGRSILQASPKTFFPNIAFIPGNNLEFFLLTDDLNQEILLSRSILKIPNNLAEKRLNEFADFFSDIIKILDMPFKEMQFYQKILALTFIFYLQNASLYLFDEVLNSFSRNVIQQWYSFFNWLTRKQFSIIFVDHHQQVKNYSQWILKDKNLLKL